MTVLLATLTGMAPFATSMFMPSLPDIARTFDVSATQVQLSVTAYLFGLAIGQIFYGPIADRFGRKPVVLAALTIFSAATIVCAVAPTVEVLIAARALQAVGGAGTIVLARAIVRDSHEGPQAARELALMSSFMALAPIIAPIFGGVLQAWFGWRSTFVALVVIALIQLIIVMFLVSETIRQRTSELSISSTFRTFGLFLRNPAYLANTALGAGAFAGGYAWLSGSAFVLQNLHGLGVVEFSIVYVISSIGFLVGNASASRLVMRYGINTTMGVGAITLLVASVALLLLLGLGINSVTALVVPSTLFLAGMGMVMPQSFAGSLMMFPNNAGAASSLAGFIQQSAGGISAGAVGFFIGESEWPVVLGIASMGIFVFVVWILTNRVRAELIKPAS